MGNVISWSSLVVVKVGLDMKLCLEQASFFGRVAAPFSKQRVHLEREKASNSRRRPAMK